MNAVHGCVVSGDPMARQCYFVRTTCSMWPHLKMLWCDTGRHQRGRNVLDLHSVTSKVLAKPRDENP